MFVHLQQKLPVAIGWLVRDYELLDTYALRALTPEVPAMVIVLDLKWHTICFLSTTVPGRKCSMTTFEDFNVMHFLPS